ncbi:hypothetical protein ACFQJ7_13835 [Halovenus rubra]|uniref:Small CPxCG-related zinc finger protein n=2 Tax=Halovenus rubra TaxID=869890 RepID=A0ABD5XD18_9EURY|nr:hypothetical protein [Halovenus rubra]
MRDALDGLLDALRSWWSPTCKAPGCDSEDTDLMLVAGRLVLLCPEHSVEMALAAVETDEVSR